jgi:pyruvate/2-oxoglutarate dehydrogenase complex dihydrolipoamide acyltransferase (E2) component
MLVWSGRTRLKTSQNTFLYKAQSGAIMDEARMNPPSVATTNQKAELIKKPRTVEKFIGFDGCKEKPFFLE